MIGWYVEGNLVLVDKRQGDDANSFTLPGYIRPDLFAGYQWDKLDVRLKFENVLDKRYTSSTNAADTVIQGNRLLMLLSASVTVD